MNFIHIVFLSGVLFCSAQTHAQSPADSASKAKQNSLFKDRIRFNIGGGIMLGNQFTNIHILPQVGYRFTDRLTAGIGGHFQYFKSTFLSNDPFLIYGGNAFGRYLLSENLFLQSEYQVLNFRDEWGEYVLLGGGYIPNGSGMYISAYLVLYPAYSELYRVPYIIRAGFMF